MELKFDYYSNVIIQSFFFTGHHLLKPCGFCSLLFASLIIYKTRMHSRGMRTARLLTVSEHALRRGDLLLVRGGVCLWFGGGCLPRGGCLPLVPGRLGCIPACNGTDTPPCGQTDTCENITFAKSFAGGNEIRYQST